MPSVDIKDQVTAALAGFRQAIEPSQINPVIGSAEVRMFQNWFLSLPPNKLGWPSTGFYADAARATNYRSEHDDVWISINKLGMRQRFEGGEIHPVDGKYLTIPARPEAYGKRAGEFGDQLQVAFRRIDGVVKAWALVERAFQEVTYGRKRKDGSRKVTPGAEHGGVMYWLVESVTQQADPNVLPPDEVILATAIETIEDRVASALRRSNGTDGVSPSPSSN